MGTWGFLPGGGQTEKSYTSKKQKAHWGRPFQTPYVGWIVSTKRCGYFEVNLSLSLQGPILMPVADTLDEYLLDTWHDGRASYDALFFENWANDAKVNTTSTPHL